MNYRKRLNEMNDMELQVCITSLFRAENARKVRTRDQNLALLTSWLHAMSLKPEHQFLFYKDETNELWLLNRDQSNCTCCKQQPTTQQLTPKSPDKCRPKYSPRSVSPKINRGDSQVTVIAIQPQRHIHSAVTSRQTSPNLPRRQIPKRPKKQNCWEQCCAECSSICSNLFS